MSEDNDTVAVGDNVSQVAKDYINELVVLAEERKRIKIDIGEIKKELKDKDLPVKDLLAVYKDEIDADQTSRSERKAAQDTARRILGLPSIRVDKVKAPVDVAADVMALAQTRVASIFGMRKEFEDIADSETLVYDKIKGLGLSVKIVKKLVVFKVSPKKRKTYDKDAELIQAYLSALD